MTRNRIVATREHQSAPVRLSVYALDVREPLAVVEVTPARTVGLAADLLQLVRPETELPLDKARA